MHEYEALYRRWKRYRLKRVITRVSLISLLLGSIGIGIWKYPLIKGELSKGFSLFQRSGGGEEAPLLLPSKEFEENLTPPSPPKKRATQKRRSHRRRETRETKRVPSPPPKRSSPVVIQEHKIDPQALERLFSKKPKLSTALLLANYYYERKGYKKAAFWALKANELDPNSRESWLLFAKSLAQSGDRNRAIAVLQVYIKKSGSPEAKALLEQITKGEIQ
ncbi:MAG: hypothetical protein GXO19_02210 [Epsilonproteobacteria bacterium]|nr:hypothetical protein [Campylobacterota bacterium]NPA56531.1 hypothetical protein [Campylobacterota bacterium]